MGADLYNKLSHELAVIMGEADELYQIGEWLGADEIIDHGSELMHHINVVAGIIADLKDEEE